MSNMQSLSASWGAFLKSLSAEKKLEREWKASRRSGGARDTASPPLPNRNKRMSSNTKTNQKIEFKQEKLSTLKKKFSNVTPRDPSLSVQYRRRNRGAVDETDGFEFDEDGTFFCQSI